MGIKIKKVSSEEEDKIITGCILSDFYLQNLFPILDRKLFSTAVSKKIMTWCIDYYKKYKKAPGNDIQNIYEAEKKFLDEDESELIEEVLSRLSEEQDIKKESFSSKYILEEGEKYLASKKIEQLCSEAEGLTLLGHIEEAEALIASHLRTERPNAQSIDILSDTKAIREVDEDTSHNTLIELSGALGGLVGPLQRQDFFSFIAPMKRGKTFWLIYLALKGLFQGRKVLFVSMEMSQRLILQRIYSSFLGSPKNEKEVTIPFFDGDTISSRSEIRKGISSKRMINKAGKLKTLVKSGSFRLLCYPSYGANIGNVKTEIQNLAHYNNFVPDIIVFDYADILAPEIGSPIDPRHRLNHTWGTMRGLAQELDALVITASQSDRSTFKKNIEENNLSEDIRKLAHVTHMMALNQTREDKQMNLMRLSMLASRNEEFQVDDEVFCLYNYGIGKACIDTRWKNEVIL